MVKQYRALYSFHADARCLHLNANANCANAKSVIWFFNIILGGFDRGLIFERCGISLQMVNDVLVNFYARSNALVANRNYLAI